MLAGQLSLIVAALFAGAGDRQQDGCRGNESGKQVHGTVFTNGWGCV